MTPAACADRGQLGFQTVVAATILAVGVLLSLAVADRFDTALGSPSNEALSGTTADILVAFGDATALLAPLFLVAIALAIIAVLRRARSG